MNTTYVKTALAFMAVAISPAFAEGMMRSTTTTTEQPASNAMMGANSIAPAAGTLTRDQAIKQFHSKGYANISNLTSDGHGAWRGTAIVDGKKRNVMIDAQGNVSAQ